jgi:hypothetical protein
MLRKGKAGQGSLLRMNGRPQMDWEDKPAQMYFQDWFGRGQEKRHHQVDLWRES